MKPIYEQIIDAAMAIMHADAASLQMYVPEKENLLLLASKGFAPESATFWQWVTPGDEQQLRGCTYQ